MQVLIPENLNSPIARRQRWITVNYAKRTTAKIGRSKHRTGERQTEQAICAEGGAWAGAA
jgi:hypothetical protein